MFDDDIFTVIQPRKGDSSHDCYCHCHCHCNPTKKRFPIMMIIIYLVSSQRLSLSSSQEKVRIVLVITKGEKLRTLISLSYQFQNIRTILFSSKFRIIGGIQPRKGESSQNYRYYHCHPATKRFPIMTGDIYLVSS